MVTGVEGAQGPLGILLFSMHPVQSEERERCPGRLGSLRCVYWLSRVGFPSLCHHPHPQPHLSPLGGGWTQVSPCRLLTSAPSWPCARVNILCCLENWWDKKGEEVAGRGRGKEGRLRGRVVLKSSLPSQESSHVLPWRQPHGLLEDREGTSHGALFLSN